MIGRLRVAPDGNEITAALEPVKGLSRDGVLVTGDAGCAQRALRRPIVDGGGDCSSVVEDDQPRLREDIAPVFAAPPPPRVPPPPGTAADRAARWDEGRGRTGGRRLEASAALAG